MDPITLLLIDDFAPIRNVLQLIFALDSAFKVIGEASGGAEGIRIADKLLPEVVLIDINMKPMNGWEATSIIHARQPLITIIGFTAEIEPTSKKLLLAAGAKGLIRKGSGAAEIRAAIKAIAYPLRASKLNALQGGLLPAH